MDKGTLIKLYNLQASNYDKSRFGIITGNYIDFLEKWYIIVHIRGTKVLDVGCGTGRFIPILNKLGINYYGIDLAENMVKVAKRRGSRFCNLLIMDGEKMGFLPNTFDSVFLVRTFKFFSEPLNFLGEVHRILKPKGRLICIYENRDAFWRKNKKFISASGGRYYTKREMELMFRSSNFNVILSKKAFLTPYVFPKFIPPHLVYLFLKLSQSMPISKPLYTDNIIIGEKV
ncbi:MAG: class I SAM-dependent methyltransferase [Thermoprotei archaeon]